MISEARQAELLAACLRYCKAHNIVPAQGASPAGGVNTTADRALISQVQGHQRGYHADKRMVVDGTFNTYTQTFLADHYAAAAPGAGGFYRPCRFHRGQPVVPPTSEYAAVDPEGACCIGGRKVHAGLDYFAGPGAEVRSPEDGTIVNVQPSGGDRYGQVFGGVVRVQVAAARLAMPNGHVWVFRHVEPAVAQGVTVHAGDLIAHVTSWADWLSGSHAHIELWKSWRYGTAGYRVDNMLDPRVFLAQAAVVEAWQ